MTDFFAPGGGGGGGNGAGAAGGNGAISAGNVNLGGTCIFENTVI